MPRPPNLQLTHGHVGCREDVRRPTVRDFPTFISDIAENHVGQRGMEAMSSESNSGIVAGKPTGDGDDTHVHCSPLSSIEDPLAVHRGSRSTLESRSPSADCRDAPARTVELRHKHRLRCGDGESTRGDPGAAGSARTTLLNVGPPRDRPAIKRSRGPNGAAHASTRRPWSKSPCGEHPPRCDRRVRRR
jgi:hypothetical protein